MSWEYLGLSMEPNLSIAPLLKRDELTYFVNRENELALLRTYFNSEFPQHILISGKAGTGKTSLVCYEGIPRENRDFVRIDLSRFQQQNDILDGITLDLIEYACKLKIKEAQSLREDFIYQKRELTEETIGAEGSVGIAKGKISSKKAVEKAKRYSSIGTEQMLRNILCAIEKNRGHLPVIFLDESDHLSESVQETVLSKIEILLITRECKVIFSTRKEVEKLFLSDANSKYRTRFTDILPLGPIKSSAGNVAKIILQKRFEPVTEKGYVYPFTEEINTFLEDTSEGSIRELLRYASYILNKAVIVQPPKPLKIDFAIETLGQKGILSSEIESKEYQILKILSSQSLSPSDKILQEKTHLKRASLSIILSKLASKGIIQRINEGKKTLYGLTAKGKWTLKVYEKVRL